MGSCWKWIDDVKHFDLRLCLPAMCAVPVLESLHKITYMHQRDDDGSWWFSAVHTSLAAHIPLVAAGAEHAKLFDQHSGYGQNSKGRASSGWPDQVQMRTHSPCRCCEQKKGWLLTLVLLPLMNAVSICQSMPQSQAHANQPIHCHTQCGHPTEHDETTDAEHWLSIGWASRPDQVDLISPEASASAQQLLQRLCPHAKAGHLVVLQRFLRQTCADSADLNYLRRILTRLNLDNLCNSSVPVRTCTLLLSCLTICMKGIGLTVRLTGRGLQPWWCSSTRAAGCGSRSRGPKCRCLPWGGAVAISIVACCMDDAMAVRTIQHAGRPELGAAVWLLGSVQRRNISIVVVPLWKSEWEQRASLQRT